MHEQALQCRRRAKCAGHRTLKSSPQLKHSCLCSLSTASRFSPLLVPQMSRSPPPLISTCIYNVPMALDHSLAHTCGLEPHHAKSRNLHMVDNSKSFILGPMPPRLFMQDFLPLDRAIDSKVLLTARKAFDSVPERAHVVTEILEPLVCLIIFCTLVQHLSRH